MTYHGASWRIMTHHDVSWRIMTYHDANWRIGENVKSLNHLFSLYSSMSDSSYRVHIMLILRGLRRSFLRCIWSTHVHYLSRFFFKWAISNNLLVHIRLGQYILLTFLRHFFIQIWNFVWWGWLFTMIRNHKGLIYSRSLWEASIHISYKSQ